MVIYFTELALANKEGKKTTVVNLLHASSVRCMETVLLVGHRQLKPD